MSTNGASLDRLHDLTLPPAIGWWPLAPGWYALVILMSLPAGWFLWRGWKNWQANAYRREALHQLTSLQDAVAIAALLRRTALAAAARTEIAGLTGSAWAEWLDRQCLDAMPCRVRQLLSNGIYKQSDAGQDISQLHGYAARWISGHRIVLPPDR